MLKVRVRATNHIQSALEALQKSFYLKSEILEAPKLLILIHNREPIKPNKSQDEWFERSECAATDWYATNSNKNLDKKVTVSM